MRDLRDLAVRAVCQVRVHLRVDRVRNSLDRGVAHCHAEGSGVSASEAARVGNTLAVLKRTDAVCRIRRVVVGGPAVIVASPLVDGLVVAAVLSGRVAGWVQVLLTDQVRVGRSVTYFADRDRTVEEHDPVGPGVRLPGIVRVHLFCVRVTLRFRGAVRPCTVSGAVPPVARVVDFPGDRGRVRVISSRGPGVRGGCTA